MLIILSFNIQTWKVAEYAVVNSNKEGMFVEIGEMVRLFPTECV